LNRIIVPALLLCLLFPCAVPAQSGLRITLMETPAAAHSQTPFLAASGTGVYATWLEGKDGTHAFRFSQWNGREWSAPGTIASGVPFFVNWADFPSVLSLPGGRIVAHWLQKSGAGSYAYNVQVSASTDGGKSWSAPGKPHTDSVENEHGFVSLAPLDRDRFLAVWLDARKFKTGSHGLENEMQLMSAVYSGGTFQADTVVDPRTCDCCQTTAVPVRDGVLVAYRDRSASEIRDISFVRYSAGKWSEPKDLSADKWSITGCPVNGPAAAAADNRVAVAWFTAAQDRPRVQIVFSTDGGVTFGKPVRVDDGNPTGRVDVEYLPDGSAVVAWMENTEGKGADLRARRIPADGKLAGSLTVAASSSARASGFPRMARTSGSILLGWTDIQGEESRVRFALIQP
jgi:hypothetical protein